MSVGIQVAVRCRPYTLDDKLGVHMIQVSKSEGEINLVNSNYSTKRFAFSWSWWSAYGWKRHQKGDEQLAEEMKLVNQGAAYEACGIPIRSDVLDGSAVVMFAYGLSGSGKTYTVFGPDDPAIPEAWFKWATPQDSWGIYPRLAYDLFEMRDQTWKFKMKYFQNVVDIVRDLMSPTGEEKMFKAGMRKDADGFMDVNWCMVANLKSWDDLRATFKKANARKAISPTQFNHQSTRGHCIMTLEVNKPKKDDKSMRQKGRIYVCDLAGTEPAGDIFYASYKKIKYPDGTIEHKLLGPHKNKKKTKELQTQGMMINLSLSEMAQFFMKMATAIKKKKLKPGKSIPGLNSYFLCRYLKDTMLQARTYLFCAIRPEAGYLKYTFSTLGFAKNASVIKLNPKKATTMATPAERKLMRQLDEMKAMMEALQKKNEQLQGLVSEPSLSGDSEELQQQVIMHQKREAELQKKQEAADQRAKELEAKVAELKESGRSASVPNADMAALKESLLQQKKLATELSQELEQQRAKNNEELKASGVDTSLIDERRKMEEMLSKKAMEMNDMFAEQSKNELCALEVKRHQQWKEYGARGISLVEVEKDTTLPHFVNMDPDPFRSKRFMFLVKLDGDTVFGKEGDIRPFTLQEPKECVVTGKNGKFTITEIGGEGFHNGKSLEKGVPVPLSNYDRVVMGSELFLFRIPTEISEGMIEPKATDMIREVEDACLTDIQRRNQEQLDKKMQEFERLKEEWHKQNNSSSPQNKLNEAERLKQQAKMDKLAMDLVSKEIHDLLPKIEHATKCCYELNRDMLTFEACMHREDQGSAPKVKVRVTKADSNEEILIESFEFLKATSSLQDERTRLNLALENDREYTVPESQDPINLFMDHTARYGSAAAFPEYLKYMLSTEPHDRHVDIKSTILTKDQSVGKLDVVWTPLNSLDEDDYELGDDMFIDKEEDLLGKPWFFKLEISGAFDLELRCSKAYVQYDFFGTLYTTERIEEVTYAPKFKYSHVHHVDSVTREFLDFLDKPMFFRVYTAPYVQVESGHQPSTLDPVVASRISGRKLDAPSLDKMDEKTLRKHAHKLEHDAKKMKKSLRHAKKKISKLTQMLKDATEEIARLKGRSHKRGDLAGAIAADTAINNLPMTPSAPPE